LPPAPTPRSARPIGAGVPGYVGEIPDAGAAPVWVKALGRKTLDGLIWWLAI